MDTNVLFMYPFSFRLDTIFEKPVAKKPHLDTLHAVKNYSMSCGTGLNGYNWTKLSTPVFLVSQCLKITKKSYSTWSNLTSFWKPTGCSQTVLPVKSILLGQKLVEKTKIKKNQVRHFGCFSNTVKWSLTHWKITFFVRWRRRRCRKRNVSFGLWGQVPWDTPGHPHVFLTKRRKAKKFNFA